MGNGEWGMGNGEWGKISNFYLGYEKLLSNPTPYSPLPTPSYFRNICSIRWVTKKPPAMLIVPIKMAMAPKITVGDHP